MSKKIIAFVTLLSIFSLTSQVYAQQVYSFSGFGGALPSSAAIEETASTKDEADEAAKKSVKKQIRKKIIIGSLIAVGVIAVGALAISYGPQAMESCGNSCGEGCANGSSDLCNQMDCGSVFDTSSCNSSSMNCSALLQNPLKLMPIYIP